VLFQSFRATSGLYHSPGSHYEGPLWLGNDLEIVSTAVFVNATRTDVRPRERTVSEIGNPPRGGGDP